jgi:hypothetical protein
LSTAIFFQIVRLDLFCGKVSNSTAAAGHTSLTHLCDRSRDVGLLFDTNLVNLCSLFQSPHILTNHFIIIVGDRCLGSVNFSGAPHLSNLFDNLLDLKLRTIDQSSITGCQPRHHTVLIDVGIIYSKRLMLGH